MRYHSIALAAALSLGFAGEAGAVAAQCFWQGNQPVGPVYRTEMPSFNNWINWVQRRGGHCRPVGGFEVKSLEKRPQVYPPEYNAERGPGYPGYRPPGYDQPPPERETGWYGDSSRAAYLVSQSLAQQGRPYAQVVDTGRVEYIYDRSWRIFFARWQDGNRARIAVRFSRREGGTYVMMQSYDRVTWTQPTPIGQ